MSFASSKCDQSFTLEVVVRCTIVCYVVPWYIEYCVTLTSNGYLICSSFPYSWAARLCKPFCQVETVNDNNEYNQSWMDLYSVDINVFDFVYRSHLLIKCVQVYSQVFTNITYIDFSFYLVYHHKNRFIQLFIFFQTTICSSFPYMLSWLCSGTRDFK